MAWWWVLACLGITQEQGVCPTRGQETVNGFVNPELPFLCRDIDALAMAATITRRDDTRRLIK